LEGDELAVSFRNYLQHSTQEDCQHQLWSELSLDASTTPAKEWPEAFYWDIKNRLSALVTEHRPGLISKP
jgi:hypothetical protein